jgi:hypothetical protein
LRPDRRADELLRKREKARGPLLAGRDTAGAPLRRSDDKTAEAPTLRELGISKQQSSNWQRLAEVPNVARPAKSQ